MNLFFTVTVILFLGRNADAKQNSKQRSVNLAVETVIEFDNEHKKQDVRFLDDIQSFLLKIKNAIFQQEEKAKKKKQTTTPRGLYYFRSNNESYRRTEDPNMKFTDFLENTIIILKTYSNSDLEKVFSILNNELTNIHNTDTEIELIDNKHFRRFIGKNMSKLKHVSAKAIRNQLRSFLTKLQELDFNKRDLALIKLLNTLYDDDSTEDFILFLSALESYKSATKRSSRDLAKIIKKGLSSIILDHYKLLDPEKKGALRMTLETYWFDITPIAVNINTQKEKAVSKKIKESDKSSMESASESKEDEELVTKAKKHKSKLDEEKRIKKAEKAHFEYEHQKPFMTLFVEPIKKERRTHSTRKMKVKRIIKSTRKQASSNEIDFQYKATETTKPPMSVVSKILEQNAVIEVDKDPVKGVEEVQHSSSKSEEDNIVGDADGNESVNKTENKNTTDVDAESKIQSSSEEAQTTSYTVKKDLRKKARVKSKGLSIESFEQASRTSIARKSNKNDSFTVNRTSPKLTVENVYSRIQELELELAEVKSKVKVADSTLIPPNERHSLSVNNPTSSYKESTNVTTKFIMKTTKTYPTTAYTETITMSEKPQVKINGTSKMEDDDNLKYWEGTTVAKVVTPRILVWKNVSKDYVNSIKTDTTERSTILLVNKSNSNVANTPNFRVSDTDKDVTKVVANKQHFNAIPVEVPGNGVRDYNKLVNSKNITLVVSKETKNSTVTAIPLQNLIVKGPRRDLKLSQAGVKDQYDEDFESD